MGFYRRLIYDAFRRYNRNIEKSVSRDSFSSRSDPRRFGISQPILKKSVLQNINQKKSPNFVTKRFNTADRNKVDHFKYGRWYENPRNLIRLGFVGCGVVIPVYYWNLEMVPYTKRRHFVLMSTCREKEIGESLFEQQKSEKYKGKILPSHHPQSVRIEKIGREIIGALLKGLRRKKEEGDEQTTTAHLEDLNWEIIVVDDPTQVNAVCFVGGKIVVFTGLLNYLQTDTEIAIVIGHEVGHVVARHYAERMSGIRRLLILQYFMTDLFRTTSDLFLRLPFSRRCEMEADYIGLLISASAGYDPRIAPQLCEKLEYSSRSILDVYRSTHPDGKKRAELLSQPKVMEEALSIYAEALKEKDKDKEGWWDLVGYLNFLNKLLGIFKIFRTTN